MYHIYLPNERRPRVIAEDAVYAAGAQNVVDAIYLLLAAVSNNNAKIAGVGRTYLSSIPARRGERVFDLDIGEDHGS